MDRASRAACASSDSPSRERGGSLCEDDFDCLRSKLRMGIDAGATAVPRASSCRPFAASGMRSIASTRAESALHSRRAFGTHPWNRPTIWYSFGGLFCGGHRQLPRMTR